MTTRRNRRKTVEIIAYNRKVIVGKATREPFWQGFITWDNGREDCDFPDRPTAGEALADVEARLADFTVCERSSLAAAFVAEFAVDPAFPDQPTDTMRRVHVPIIT